MKIIKKLNILYKEIYIGGYNDSENENKDKTYGERVKDYGKHTVEFAKDTYQQGKEIVLDKAKRDEVLNSLKEYIPNKQERREFYEKIKDESPEKLASFLNSLKEYVPDKSERQKFFDEMKGLSAEKLADTIDYFEAEIKPQLNDLYNEVKKTVVEKGQDLHKNHFNMSSMFDFNKQQERVDIVVDGVYSTTEKVTEQAEQAKEKIKQKMGDFINRVREIRDQRKEEKEGSPDLSYSEERRLRTQVALLNVAYEQYS